MVHNTQSNILSSLKNSGVEPVWGAARWPFFPYLAIRLSIAPTRRSFCCCSLATSTSTRSTTAQASLPSPGQCGSGCSRPCRGVPSLRRCSAQPNSFVFFQQACIDWQRGIGWAKWPNPFDKSGDRSLFRASGTLPRPPASSHRCSPQCARRPLRLSKTQLPLSGPSGAVCQRRPPTASVLPKSHSPLSQAHEGPLSGSGFSAEAVRFPSPRW